MNCFGISQGKGGGRSFSLRYRWRVWVLPVWVAARREPRGQSADFMGILDKCYNSCGGKNLIGERLWRAYKDKNIRYGLGLYCALVVLSVYLH
ncbi:hypothetical protein FUAX_02430 [Fulvitalea axinellae]|uniref:Uncharacterized protein n=1 Tax=Fulvitalea axinellae TaxID=1182444 RepID=A0AAU9D4T0_9BACT|nr:hypothetical protein FUAX_02430 [Fulvitalea axinellae]